MTLKAPDYMDKSIEIIRSNALDGYFTEDKTSTDTSNIRFEIIREHKITQLVVWPDTIDVFQNHIASLPISGDFMKPGKVSELNHAKLVRIEPLKWWALDNYQEEFNTISEQIALPLDLSHSWVQLKITGLYATRILSHHIPVDLREKQFPVGNLVTTSMHHVGVKLCRNHGDWRFFIPRSFSVSLWQMLCDTAQQYGYNKE